MKPLPNRSILTDEMHAAMSIPAPPVTFEVEKGAMLRYAAASGQTLPEYTDELVARHTRYGGLIASPMFLCLVKVPIPKVFDNALEVGMDWTYYEPVRPGDVITATTRVIDVHERTGRRMGPMILLTDEQTYTNQFDEVVCRRTRTHAYYAGTPS
jgi:acyl dehydratase